MLQQGGPQDGGAGGAAVSSDIGAVLYAIHGMSLSNINPTLTNGKIGVDVGVGAAGEGVRCHYLITKTASNHAHVSLMASAAALERAVDVSIWYNDEATFIKLLLKQM